MGDKNFNDGTLFIGIRYIYQYYAQILLIKTYISLKKSIILKLNLHQSLYIKKY
jgi:hypothetical protein